MKNKQNIFLMIIFSVIISFHLNSLHRIESSAINFNVKESWLQKRKELERRRIPSDPLPSQKNELQVVEEVRRSRTVSTPLRLMVVKIPIETKNEALEKLLKNMNDFNYWEHRPKVLELVLSGADLGWFLKNYSKNQFGSDLLHRAVVKDDGDMIDILFNHGVDSNGIADKEPVFFRIRSVSVAKKFVKKGVNLHVKGQYKSNVLRSLLKWFDGYYPDVEGLLQFYYEHDVDATVLKKGNYYLLRTFIKKLCKWEKHNGAIEFLITKMPQSINTKDYDGMTPLDIVYDEQYKFEKNNRNYDEIIALLEKYGAKRGCDL